MCARFIVCATIELIGIVVVWGFDFLQHEYVFVFD